MILYRRGSAHDARPPQIRLRWDVPPEVKILLWALAVIAFTMLWPGRR